MDAILSENMGDSDIPDVAGLRPDRACVMELLPDAAIPAIEAAFRDLVPETGFRPPISVVYAAFCAALDTLSIEPPSRASFYAWAHGVVDGTISAHGLIQSDGDLRPSSALLLANAFRRQAIQLEASAREMRVMADEIAKAFVDREACRAGAQAMATGGVA